MIRTPGLHCANRSRSNRSFVSALDGRWSVMKSAWAQSSSSVSSSAPRSSATWEAMNGSWATSRISNAWARRATSRPMRPKPTTPSVLPRSSESLECLLLPSPILHLGVRQGDRPGQREHQRARVLRDTDAGGRGRVHDEDATRTGRVEVDVVDPGSRARNDAEVRGSSDEVRIDRGRAANDQPVGFGDVSF